MRVMRAVAGGVSGYHLAGGRRPHRPDPLRNGVP